MVDVLQSQGLAARTILATGWAVALQVVRQVYQVVVWVVLARVLTPEDYGLVGMATVVTGFVNTFASMGLSQAIVQRKKLDEDHINATFWGGIGIGVLLSLLVMGLSPIIAAFYHEPRLVLIVSVVSLGFIANALPAVHLALFQRKLQFKQFGIATAFGLTLAMVVSLVMAHYGWGVWSLVISPLLIGPATLLPATMMLGWKPRLSFHWHKFRDLIGFGSIVAGASMANYASNNIDYLLIGRFLGPGPLGIYTLAYNLMIFPLVQVSGTVAQPLYSSMSRVQDDEGRMRKGYLKAVYYVASVAFPLMAVLFVISPELVSVVYGQQWSAAIPLIKVFCVAGAIRSVGTFSGTIFRATARPQLEFRWALVVIGIFFPMLLITTQKGIVVVALGVTLAYLTLTPIVVLIANRLIHLPWTTYVSNLWYPALSSLVVMLCTWLARSGAAALKLNAIVVLAISLVTAGSVYLGTMWLLNRRLLLETMHLVLRSRHGQAGLSTGDDL